MERDPILFAWRSARTQHALSIALALGLGTPLAILALLSLRDLVALLGVDSMPPMHFLDVSIPLAEQPARRLTLFSGFPFETEGVAVAALAGLVVSALGLAGLGFVVARVCFAAQTRAAGRLRSAATEAILQAPASAREDVRLLPALVGRVLAGMPAALLLLPAMTLAAVIVALATATLVAPRLVPVAAIGLAALTLARILLLRRSNERTSLRRTEREAAEAVLGDLILRMPAVRRHGAALFERRRLGLRARVARGTLSRAEGAMAYARAPTLALLILLPGLLVATALLGGPSETTRIEAVTHGALAASGVAFALAAVLLARLARLWFDRNEVAPHVEALARTLDALSARRPQAGRASVPFPESGDLVAHGAGAFDPASGERLSGFDARLTMPSHIAIVGGPGSGAQALAALLAGQTEPTVGSIRYGEVDLRSLDAAERAHRIAFAGTEAILIEGSIKQNLLYGARLDDREAVDLKGRIELLKLAGLDAFVYARGLEGRIDPEDEPVIARKIVSARGAVRLALSQNGIARLVEPFDPVRYNHQATVGENILFGEAVDLAFSEENLARHPYLWAVLEAESLTKVFVEIGLQVARATVEIFSDLPDGHSLFDAFSLFPASDRGFFEDLVARQPDGQFLRRGAAGQRDRERLIGLALRYSETRHRFGLIDEALEERIVSARRSFATMLPPKYREKIEIYDPARVTAAASFEENLLFGRITQGEAGAESRVRGLVRQVLAEEGLEPIVYRLGLLSRVGAGLSGGRRQGMGEGAIGPRERVAIDLVRCLVRRPDILVVGLFPEDRRPDEVAGRVARLRAVREGRGLIVCLPNAETLEACAPFDEVLTVERNTVVAAPSRSAAMAAAH